MKEWKDESKTDWAFIGYILGVCLFIWLFITVNIQRFKHPHLTETQLMMNIPKSFMLDFSEKE